MAAHFLFILLREQELFSFFTISTKAVKKLQTIFKQAADKKNVKDYQIPMIIHYNPDSVPSEPLPEVDSTDDARPVMTEIWQKCNSLPTPIG